MVRLRYCAFLFLLLLSCKSIECKILGDGITKIPAGSGYFDENYRKFYSLKLPRGIEPNSVFIEKYFVDEKNRWYPVSDGMNSFISAVKFYELGQVSLFNIQKDKPLDSLNFNPNYTGYRGVSFVSDRKETIEIIAPIDETYVLGKVRYYIELKNDTLSLRRKGFNQKTIYVRCFGCETKGNYDPDW